MILNRAKYYSEKEKMKKNEEEDKENIEKDQEIEEEEEEFDYEDNHNKKMINSQDNIPRLDKINKFIKNKISYYKIFFISSVVLIFLIILISLINRNRNNSNDLIALSYNQTNETKIDDTENKNNNNNSNNNNEETEKKKINEELINLYNSIGEINIMKFYEEYIEKKPYIFPDSSKFTNIHINIGFTENDINLIIKHLSSILHHSAQTTYIHIHIMDADTFNCDSLVKLRNMIYKINNNTEIKIYNASPALKDFKIKEDSISKFSKDYAKLYAFKILKDIQKIIFLDSDDCMVEKDLSELYNLELNDIYGRGISDVPSIKNPVDWLDKYLFDKSHYINGGVILVNLELCQKDSFYQKAIELNNNEFYMNTQEPAQDILNVLMRKKIEFFHPKYNKINFYEKPEDRFKEEKWYPWVSEALKLGEKNNHFYTKEELVEADNDPVIIHYAWDTQLNKVIKKYEDEKNFYAKMVDIS